MLLVSGEFRVNSDDCDEFAALAGTLGVHTRAEEGCRFFEFWADLDRSGRFLVFEGWESAAHLEAHRGTPHVVDFKTAAARLGMESLGLTRYEAIEVDV
jgi:quinol monooxygenase YgiN